MPLILAFFNWKYSTYNSFRWGYNHINEISIFSLLIGTLGSVLVYFLNRKTLKSIFWTILSVFVVVITLIYTYIINSLSHFGF